MIDHQLQNCVNFGRIKIELPCQLSKVTGFYKNINFEFSDVTIKTLVFDLDNWVKTASEVELSEMRRINLQIKIPLPTITNVSPKVLLNFVQTFPKEFFKLVLDLDIYKLCGCWHCKNKLVPGKGYV